MCWFTQLFGTNPGELMKHCNVPRSGSLTLKSIAASNQSDFYNFGHILNMLTLTNFGNKYGPRWRHHHFCSKLEFWAEICFGESFLEENDQRSKNHFGLARQCFWGLLICSWEQWSAWLRLGKFLKSSWFTNFIELNTTPGFYVSMKWINFKAQIFF